MAQPTLDRGEVYELIQEAKRGNKDRNSYVKEKLTERYPDLVTTTIVRNGHIYKALDYLELDLDSYGNEA